MNLAYLKYKIVASLGNDSLRVRVFLHTLPIYALSLLLSFKSDTSVMRSREIFPWDSRVYFQLSNKLFTSSELPIYADYPWGARLLFPFLSGLYSRTFNQSSTTSTLVINQLAVLFVCIFCVWYWKKIGISPLFSIAGIMILVFSFVGPLRTSMYYPGNGYAVECAIAAATYLALLFLKKNSYIWTIMACLSLFVLALGREFSTYLVIIFFLVRETYRSLEKYRNKQTYNIMITEISRMRIIVACAFSVAGLLVTRRVTMDARGDFPFLRAAFTNGWDHLNIFNTIYPYYYALGPITVLLILGITFSRSTFQKRKSIEIQIGQLFAIVGIAFSLFVGGDTDRFIWWFFPFLTGLALVTTRNLMEISALSRSHLITLAIVTVIWSRVFLPAIPPIQFVGDKHESFALIRTDYSAEKFYGLRIFEQYRLPQTKFVFSDPLELSIESKRQQKQVIMLPTGTNATSQKMGILPPAYSYRLNEYPFPFGYLHNQFEMFTLHPQHGERKAKIILFSQWALLQAFLTVSILRRSGLRLRRWA